MLKVIVGADYFKAFDDIFEKIHLLYKKNVTFGPDNETNCWFTQLNSLDSL